MDASSQTSNGSQAAEAARRKWPVEERLRIVQASLKKGTTVDAVAKVYGVHARQLYNWRKQHRQGLLGNEIAAMLPVQVAEASRCAVPKPDAGVVIEGRGARVTISGSMDVAVIRMVLDCLAQ
jgi:transposase-like protein